MFDYVIVGAGSAGCVLANRLSADGKSRVALIEAGPPDKSLFIRMPSGVLPLLNGTTYNWAFRSTPQVHLGGREILHPRGKTLGGSSSINGMIYTRGHAWDYDHWASLGCDGWSYAQVLPYFCKSENYTPPLAVRDRPFHGFQGPLTVCERRYTNPLSSAFVAAAQLAGHPLNTDFNGAEQAGVGQYKVFQRNGSRCSNALAYLRPASRRDNLRVFTGTRALSLVFDGRRAAGVRVRDASGERTISAAREVILSAGAFQSPQLLLLSGIGPVAELARHGIGVRHALAGVGENLQDHTEVIVETRARSWVGPTLHRRGAVRRVRALLQYLLFNTGEMTSNIGEAGGFLRSTPDESIPDLQWHFLPIPNTEQGTDMRALQQGTGYSLMVTDLRPLSRGRVGLVSADPMAAPSIDPNYLSDARDVERLVAGVKLTREVLRQAPFDAHRDIETDPGPQVCSDDELRDWVHRRVSTVYHPVGTCKMGVDELAVVDPQLRVRGLDGLRVADASIMPTLVGSNTNAPTTMIAEKAADLVLASRS